MNQATVPGASHVVVTPTKSVGIQILLILFLGPLGLFYSTVKGALVMLLGVPVVGVFVAALGAASAHASQGGSVMAVLGGFAIMIPVMWIGSFIWGVAAVKSYNKKLLGGFRAA